MATLPDRPPGSQQTCSRPQLSQGALQSRSAKQQLDHWTRVGRAVSMQHTAARRRVEAALAGELREQDLSVEEGVVLNAEIDAGLSERARTTSFGEILAGRGVTTVAMDDNGVLTRNFPDGSTTPLA